MNPLAIAHPATLLEPDRPGSPESEEAPKHPNEEGVTNADDDEEANPTFQPIDPPGGPNHIEISDAMVDPNPFDPSYCDQEWYIALHEAARVQSVDITSSSPTAIAFARILARSRRPGMPQSPTGLLSRVFGSNGGGGGTGGGGSSPRNSRTMSRSPRSGPPGILATPSSPGSAWRMNLSRHRRGSTVGAPLVEGDEDDDCDTVGGIGHEHNRRGVVQEPGVLLSGTSPKTWGLMSLQEAQERGDIMRRAEGYELRAGSSVVTD